MRQFVHRVINIFLGVLIVISFSACSFVESSSFENNSQWREGATNIKVYEYYQGFNYRNNNQIGLGGFYNRPYVESEVDGDIYVMLNGVVYKLNNNSLEEIYDTQDEYMVLIGHTKKYIYTISELGSKYTIYRYSFEERNFETLYSSEKENEEYGFETIGKYAWIEGEDCLLTTLKYGANNIKMDYTAIYIFSDDDSIERYEITDETKEINKKYKCQKIEDRLFITNANGDWYIECFGTNDCGNVTACNGKMYESGQVEEITGYEDTCDGLSHIGAYTWYVHSVEDTVIFPITGACVYKNDYLSAINVNTSDWRYDAIDIIDTNTDERYTLYKDDENRIIGFNIDANEVYLYKYSDNTLVAKDMGTGGTRNLSKLDDTDTITFVWEGTNLIYFYGLGENMQYGGMVDIAE